MENKLKNGKNQKKVQIDKSLVKILLRPDLLKYVNEAFNEKAHDKAIKGEIHSKLTAFMLCNAMNLGYYLMLVFKGSSSIGKTNLANIVTGLFKTKKIGEISPTALKYSDDDDYSILYFQETSENESKRKSFKFISSDDGGFAAETTIKNPETGEFEIQRTEVAAKGFVTTTTAIELDKEFSTRSFLIPLDESQKQTNLIVDYNLSATKRIIEKLEGYKEFGMKYNNLKIALGYLGLYKVVIPFENEIKSLFPTKNMPLRVRRDSKKLITLIKASALLFQFQRPKIIINDNMLLVATWQDLYNAIKIAMPIMNATMTGYDSRTKKAIELIPEIIIKDGGITSENLSTLMGDISQNYAGRILKQLNESGYVYEDVKLKKKLGIKGKTLVYAFNNKNRIETCNEGLQEINWSNVLEKQQIFLERYRANCRKNEKNLFIVEYFLEEYQRFGDVVLDATSNQFVKLEQDNPQNQQFAVLTSEEEQSLKTNICQSLGCKRSLQDSITKAQKTIQTPPEEWGWWNEPEIEQYLDAETEILKILDNSSHNSDNRIVQTTRVVDIMYSLFEYSESQIYQIIDYLKEIGDVIEPKNGYLKLNII